jgi:hypothetical protein
MNGTFQGQKNSPVISVENPVPDTTASDVAEAVRPHKPRRRRVNDCCSRQLRVAVLRSEANALIHLELIHSWDPITCVEAAPPDLTPVWASSVPPRRASPNPSVFRQVFWLPFATTAGPNRAKTFASTKSR